MDLNSRASRKKLMVQLRCHARAYKGIAAASVTFCAEGGSGVSDSMTFIKKYEGGIDETANH